MTRLTLFIGLCMALSGCPTANCPTGSTRVGTVCVLDDAGARDAGPSDAPSLDACVATAWFRDRDGDGFGNASDSLSACVAPTGYVAMDGDCNDASNAAHPGVVELCNRADDDCDGASDEGLTRTLGEPVVIATDNPSAGQVGILDASSSHLLVWSEFSGGTRNIVSSAIQGDDSTRPAHTLAQGFPISLHALSADEAMLLYQPDSLDSTQLLARRMSTVLGNAEWIGDPVVIEDAPECCRIVTTGITDDRIIFTWHTEARPETFARSCARDLTDCTPRVTLFTEVAFATGFAGNGPNPILFFAATLPGDTALTSYADRIDARTLAFENRPIRLGTGTAVSFPASVANNLLGETGAVIVATETGERELIRFEAGTLGEDIRILGRTTLVPLANGGLLGSLVQTRGGFQAVSDSGPDDASSNQVNWESFTRSGEATAPVSWIGPHPTSFAATEGGFLRSEDPPRIVFQRTGCE